MSLANEGSMVQQMGMDAPPDKHRGLAALDCVPGLDRLRVHCR